MERYKVLVVESYQKVIEVVAETDDEAVNAAHKKWFEGDVEIGYSDFTHVDFKVIG